MSQKQVTLEALVRDYLTSHEFPPEWPEDIVSDREDCFEVQAGLEAAIVPGLPARLQQSDQLYDSLKSRLDPEEQALLAKYSEVQTMMVSDYETLAWAISAEVQRQILTMPTRSH